jgi:hypothetical protein
MIGASNETSQLESSHGTQERGRKVNLTVQVLASYRPGIGREQNSHNPSIPKHTDELERLAPPTKTPRRLGKALRSAQQSAETDEAIGSRTRNTGCGDERSESHVRWENGAGNECGNTPDDDHGVPGLTVVHFGDPAGKGEHTITGDSKHQARRGDDGDRSVLSSKD